MEIIPWLKGVHWNITTYSFWEYKFSFRCRIGWLTLVSLCTYFAFSICIDQVSRFIGDPFIYTVETNDIGWTYSRPAYTICLDYVNNTFIDQYYKRSENVTSIDKNSKDYLDYYRYMKIIGSLNAENIHLTEEFENAELFKELSGEELFHIAQNVWSTLKSVLLYRA